MHAPCRRSTRGQRLFNLFLAFMLAVTLTPAPVRAYADDASSKANSANLDLVAGTYVEHEALAYVLDGGWSLPEALSTGGRLIGAAETLMDADTDTTQEALEYAADAEADGEASNDADQALDQLQEAESTTAPSNGALGLFAAPQQQSDTPQGRLVLVHNDGMTTGQIIAALEADDCVAFAEPNYLADTEGASTEASTNASALGSSSSSASSTASGTSSSRSSEEQSGTQSGSQSSSASSSSSASGSSSSSGANGQSGSSSGTSSSASDGSSASSGSSSSGSSDAGDSTGATADPFQELMKALEAMANTQPKVVSNDNVGLVPPSPSAAADIDSFAWGARNSGVFSGQTGEKTVDVDYPGWSDPATTTEDGNTCIVAVVDEGVDATNPDLAGKLWSLSDEPQAVQDKLRPLPGVDEHGFYEEYASGGGTSTSGMPTSEDHGTHVAGTIAAAWNGQGTSGISENAKVMSVRFGSSSIAGIIRCVEFVATAAEAGVKVRLANNSWTLGQRRSQLALAVAVTRLGEAGVTSVFASGNSSFDTDTASTTTTILKNNPYVVAVDALNPNGNLARYSNYGATTTDVMASGSDVLSTVLQTAPNLSENNTAMNYLAEEDAVDRGGLLYQSFDEKSYVSTCIDPEGTTGNLSFTDTEGNPVGTVVDGIQRFDGTGACKVDCDAEPWPGKIIASQQYDFSKLSEKPTCLSLRYYTLGANGSTSNCRAQVLIAVPIYYDDETGDHQRGWSFLQGNAFGMFGEGWSGCWIPLGENIAWDQFRIVIMYRNFASTYTGGELVDTPAAGSILLDSIGIGYNSGLVPYGYKDGTSMATPTTTGVGAVFANSVGAEDSAAKLAARIKGSTVYDERYEGMCSTEGYVTVSCGSDPGPVPVSATVSSDGSRTMSVGAYFADENTTVTVDGVQVGGVTVTPDAAAADGRVTLTFKAPDSWTGGETVIGLTGAAGAVQGHERIMSTVLDNDTSQAYYDEQNLPLPDGIGSWDAVNLVAYAGKVYALERSDDNAHAKLTDPITSIPVYDPATKAWSDLALPSDRFVLPDGTVDKVADLTAVPIDGKLFFRGHDDGYVLADDGTGSACNWYFAYDAGTGAWEVYGYDDAFGNVPALATLGFDGTDAYLFGGTTERPYGPAAALDSNAIFKLDVDKIRSNAGATTQITDFATQVGTLQKMRIHPCVAYGNGAFLVGNGYQGSTSQMGGSTGIECVTFARGKATSALVDITSQMENTGQLSFGVAAVADGFMAVGPKNRDGNADTYLISREGALTGTYAKRASADNLLVPSATATGGRPAPE